MLGHFIRNGLRNFWPVKRVNGIKQRHRFFRFVGLQRPDQMQTHIGKFSFERWPFSLRFLHAIFAKVAMARFKYGTEVSGFKRLGYSDERDRRGRAFDRESRSRNAGVDTGKCCHRIAHDLVFRLDLAASAATG